MMSNKVVKIIGGGLAGSEAAYNLAQNNIKVKLYEMRSKVKTPVHKTNKLAELVCSNSFRSSDITNAVGLLKEEMRRLGSIILSAAEKYEIPGGTSLMVDRELFSNHITDLINNHPLIEVIEEEVSEINVDELTVIAAGPLASLKLSAEIQKYFGNDKLFFFDAVAPIIDKDSIDFNKCYFKSRYDKGEANYLNCPMTKSEYDLFYNELINAEKVIPKDFESNVFEGCMPVEVLASRGIDTLRFGPLKPVGLEHEGERPYAVVQLRPDNLHKTMYNMVGFQTHMTWGEQKRVIRLIPGLEKADILRYGVIHRNTYINSPEFLNSSYQSREYPNIFLAGQISGVEGYVESAASGLNVSYQIINYLKNNEVKPFPEDTVIGSMGRYISTPNVDFVPMNANFGLLPPINIKARKREKREMMAKRSLESLSKYLEDVNND